MSQFIGKDPDTGKYWTQEEKGITEDQMVGCHHWSNGQEFGQAREVMWDQEAWCAAVHGGRKESDMTDWIDWIMIET